MFVIFVPETVTRTWTSPYWLGASSPVAVLVDGVVFAAVVWGAGAFVVVGDENVLGGDAAETRGCVWKLRTPATPAAVPAITNGARFIGVSWFSGRPSEGEGFDVKAVAAHAGRVGGAPDQIVEPVGTADVDLAPTEVGHEALQRPRIQVDLGSRSHELVQSAPPGLDELRDLVAQDEVRGGRGTDEHGDVHLSGEVLEQGAHRGDPDTGAGEEHPVAAARMTCE